MWWKWILFVICGLATIACVVDTTISWIKGKTGPFGPKPEDWWWCGVFTVVLLAVMYWLSRTLFMS
jgi:hypothetical protein